MAAQPNIALLNIISYNMKGHAIDRASYVKSLLNVSDFVFVQEHWYLNSEITEFCNYFSHSHVVAVSGVDDDELLLGRPYGGCAILYKDSLAGKVHPVQSASRRLVSVIVTLESCRFLLVNVYMPCDTSNVDQVYDDVLDEINLIIRLNDDINYLIIGGDFNTDLSRSSYHTRRLRDFCGEEDLFTCNNHLLHPLDFTFQSPLGHRSIIDHFFVSENLSGEPQLKCPVIRWR